MGMSYKDMKLNSAQTQAIEHIDGPLLVIAGPGTGKTQLLSSRVAYILRQTDSFAKNILCLTFTNKAALNMKQRILAITDGKARDVNVKTFHSFASEIMNIYPDYFWNGARLSTAPDAVQQEIIQNILSDLPLNNPLALKFYGKFTSVGDVLQGLRLAKEAGLTPEKLEAIVKANLAYIDLIEPELTRIMSERLNSKKLDEFKSQIDELPDQNVDEYLAPLVSLSTTFKESMASAIQLDEGTGKTKNTGEWKKRWTQTINGERGMFTERRRNDWWLNLADVYAKYRKDLHARGYYDYSDMLVEVITQLESNPDLLASVQEQFNYVMIDEFQDTNSAQLRLAHLVSDHFSAEGKPNIMVVGDDDQSIFKFNGAELSNILHFKRTYPRAETVVLKDNYRSHQDILDLSAKVMEQADDRLSIRDPSLDKNLIANSGVVSAHIQHRSYQTADEQIYDMARLVASEYSPDQTQAVIARSHTSLMRIASNLLALNIPLNYEQQRNILDHPIIEQVYNLAQICEGINSGDIELVNVFVAKSLSHKMWGLSPKNLWQVAVDNYKEPDWLGYLSEHSDPNMNQIGQFLLDLSSYVASENIFIGLEYLLGLRDIDGQKSPIYKYYVVKRDEQLNEYLYGLSAIKTLRSLVNEYSSKPKASLVDFVNFIITERNSGQVINDESPFVTGQHAVNLLSVHKAKGLEFDKVYIIDASEEIWSPKKGGRKSPINLPLQPILDDMDDYIRLMFVAITRAKSSLVISSFSHDYNGKETLATPLISSVLPGVEISDTASPIDILEDSLTWPRLSSSDEKSLLKARLDNYSLSVTHLFNFLDVSSGGPAKFLERNLLRLPEVKTTSLAFGTAMHSALETAQILTNLGEFSMDKVKDSFNNALLKEHMTVTDLTKYKDHGYKLLDKLFAGEFVNLSAGSLPEQDLKDVFLGQARLSGKLDRIDVMGDEVVVSDYKTGTPLHSFTTKSENLQIKAWKQRTQLIFYALLLENSARFDIKNKQLIGQMIYLEADTPKEFIRQYQPSREEIDKLEKLIKVVWHKIINLDLPDTSKYSPNYQGVQDFIQDLFK